ncbi:MAG: kynurenine 3-monooxygenase, partial [Bacteroidetes bacterium]|nr:kynurenine 3-monooxygenase [Bacteroidota bacterium]
HRLSENYSKLFTSQYERVTFSSRDYSEALEFGAKNDKILQHIIDNKLEGRLDDRDFIEALLLDMLA